MASFFKNPSPYRQPAIFGLKWESKAASNGNSPKIK
jgi:hypothetical protein